MIQTIRKWRRLPSQGQVTVQVGDCVQPDTIVGRLDYIPGRLNRVGAAQQLGIPNEALTSAMCRRVGDRVAAGDRIAYTNEFYSPRCVISPQDGYINHVSTVLGNIYLREPLQAAASQSPIILNCQDFGISLVQFAATVGVQEGRLIEKGHFIAGKLSDKNGRAQRVAELQLQPLPDGTVIMKPPSDGSPQPMVSPIFGRVASVSLREGKVVIRPLYLPTEVKAYMRGTVTAVHEGEGCEITARGYAFAGTLGYGGEQVGKLIVIPPELGPILQPTDLPAALEGSIIVAQGSMAPDTLTRCVALGCRGIVLGSIAAEATEPVLRANPFRDIGSNGDLPVTIVAMQGYGDYPMSSEIFQQLRAMNGQIASICGATQLRAGVIRPELIIIPAELPAVRDGGLGQIERAATGDGIGVGTRVTMIRNPGFGQTGIVTELSQVPKRLPSGVVAPTAAVRVLGSGQVIVTALANLRPVRGE